MAKPIVLLDPNMATKPEILQLVENKMHRAVSVHVFAYIYVSSHATEGLLPRRALKFVHGRLVDARALVDVGLWQEVAAGWGLIDWAESRLHRPRIPVSRLTRAAVFERDGFACQKCGSTERLSIDHIVPWVLGGANNIDNLQTLCLSCNSKKRDSTTWS